MKKLKKMKLGELRVDMGLSRALDEQEALAVIGWGSFPDEEPTSDICDRYNADSSFTGLDQFECNDTDTYGWPRVIKQYGKGSLEDWFNLEDLSLDKIWAINWIPSHERFV